MKGIWTATILVGLSFLSEAPVGAASFRILQPGSPERIHEAKDVSADGSIVVMIEWTADGREAWRWTEASNELTPIWPWIPLQTGVAAISADGSTIIGGDIRWTQSSGYVPLPLGLSGKKVNAMDVSGDGSVIVGSVPMDGLALRWTEALGWQDLGQPVGDNQSQALAVSDDGAVVAGTSKNQTATQVFRWTADGGMVGLGSARPWFVASDVAISGDALTIAAGSDSGGFRWRNATGWDATPLGFSPRALSGDGSVIVGGRQYNENKALIWDEAHGKRDLQDVLTQEYGLDLQGRTLRGAAAISPDGRVIVGEASFVHQGQPFSEIYVATIPEPSSLISLLAAATAGLLLAWRRRRETG